MTRWMRAKLPTQDVLMRMEYDQYVTPQIIWSCTVVFKLNRVLEIKSH